MEKSTTELTNEYIKEHPDIKNCLKKGLINYSSLARLISKELKIEKKSSKEAILIAARRFKMKLEGEMSYEKKIKEVLASSEIEVKNKIAVLILEKGINYDSVDDVQKEIRKSSGSFYLLEGSDNYTIIIQEKFLAKVEEKFKNKVIKVSKGLVMLNLKSSKEIEKIAGVLAYLTALFGENGVNIVEFLSCWTDTLFVIEEKDLGKAIEFLRF